MIRLDRDFSPWIDTIALNLTVGLNEYSGKWHEEANSDRESYTLRQTIKKDQRSTTVSIKTLTRLLL